MELFNKESPEVTAVATLLGCKPGSGIVNVMNELQRSGFDGPAYGDWYRAFLIYHLSKANT